MLRVLMNKFHIIFGIHLSKQFSTHSFGKANILYHFKGYE
jgi:hypothetical protein